MLQPRLSLDGFFAPQHVVPGHGLADRQQVVEDHAEPNQ